MRRLRGMALVGVGMFAACAERRALEAATVAARAEAEVEVEANAPSPYAAPLSEVLARDAPPEELWTLAASWEDVRAFYTARRFEPLFVERGGLTEEGRRVVRTLRSAHDDGLSPERYGADALGQRAGALEASGTAPADDAINTELALLDAALRFTRDLSVGLTTPEDGGARWAPPAFSTNAALRHFGDHGVEATFQAARPRWAEYQGLREALAQYRALATRGGWPIMELGPPLEPGDDSPRVAALRERLRVTGELRREDAGQGTRYDDALVEAVKRFQERHGLEVDGRVGGRTLKALRVPVEERIAQVELNLERWRWMPARPEDRVVLVNVGGFELFAYQDGERVLRMRVIAGGPQWQTPLFLDELESLTIHPTWVVPGGIVTRELLPKLREDPEFAEDLGLRVIDTEAGAEVTSSEVDWLTVEEDALTYRFKQAPGARNPLGAIRFELPNRHAVYLHHTDNPKLFEQAERGLSHGCVRVEDPLGLARFLLRDDAAMAEVQRLIEDGVSKRVELPEKVPVRFVYFTAWRDDDGSVQFRDDVYWLDARLAKAIERVNRPAQQLAETSPEGSG